MSNYTITTNFGAKDSLPSGNAGKVIKGSEFTTEFTNIQTAIATKADTAGDTFTGAVTFDAAVTLNSTATITGDLTVDTDTLFVDVSADKVGIGTSSPLADLHVSNGTNSDSTPVEFMIGGSANSVRTGSIVKGTTSGAYDLTLQTSNHASQNQPLIIKLSDATEAMRIDSSGNVGIGTASPAKKLHVLGGDVRIESTFPRLYLTDSNNNSDYSIINNNGQFGIYDDTNATYRMVINNTTGKVGIGTNSPSSQLHVSSTDSVSITQTHTDGNTVSFKQSGTGGDVEWRNGNGEALILTGSQTRMTVDSSGKVGIGETNPSNPFHLKAATNIPALIETTHSNGNSRLRFSTASGTDWSIGANSNGNFTLFDAVNNNNCFNVEAGAGANTLVIDSNSRVGIGTEAPASTLHIQAPANALQLNNANEDTYMKVCGDRAQFGYRASDGFAIVQGAGGKGVAFGVNNATFGSGEAMRIDSTGKVGINTISPNKTLEVRGEIGVGPSGSTDVNQLSTFRNWTSGGDADIYALMPQSSTSSGTILESRPNAHFVIGLKDNDVNDIFSIVSTGGTFDTAGSEADRDYDKLIFCARGSTGFVGVGTNDPQREFEVTGSGNVYVKVTAPTANDSTGLELANTGATWLIQNDDTSNEALTFDRAGTEVMRIDESGNVLIGKTSSSVINTVGIEAHPTGLLVATRDSNVPLIANRKTSDGDIAQFRKDNTTVGSISVTSSATTYNTSSDERLKENITDSADAGSKVDAIQIRQFDWKSDGSHQDYGVIAQELVTVAPEAVHQPEDAEEMMGVDYSKLVPMLIKEIQSLRSRVAELENQ